MKLEELDRLEARSSLEKIPKHDKVDQLKSQSSPEDLEQKEFDQIDIVSLEETMIE